MPTSASWAPSWSGCSAPWPCVAPPSVPRRRSPGDRARGPARRRRPPARLRRRELPVARAPGPRGPAPRSPGVLPRIRRLVEAFGDRVMWTRFVAPTEPVGAWKEYYEQFPFALQPPDAEIYRLVEDPGTHPVVDATTFGKWGPDLVEVVGNGPLTVVGVATDCCVLSTVLPEAH